MKRLKRISVLIMGAVMCLTAGLCMTGCKAILKTLTGYEDPLPEFEDEYFRYAIRTKKDGTKECYLMGFTELGAEQTELILPSEFEGIPIVDFGYARKLGWGSEDIDAYFHSDKLKKMYVSFAVDESTWLGYQGVYYEGAGLCYMVKWKNLARNFWSGKGSIIGFNLLSQFLSGDIFNNHNLLANISYMYNYERAEDDGYYWVDSYDNETVKFIPPDPVREGYAFGGWYKEAECENKWDFEQDKTGEKIVIEAHSEFCDYEDSPITVLYAKWEKI